MAGRGGSKGSHIEGTIIANYDLIRNEGTDQRHSTGTNDISGVLRSSSRVTGFHDGRRDGDPPPSKS